MLQTFKEQCIIHLAIELCSFIGDQWKWPLYIGGQRPLKSSDNPLGMYETLEEKGVL